METLSAGARLEHNEDVIDSTAHPADTSSVERERARLSRAQLRARDIVEGLEYAGRDDMRPAAAHDATLGATIATAPPAQSGGDQPSRKRQRTPNNKRPAVMAARQTIVDRTPLAASQVATLAPSLAEAYARATRTTKTSDKNGTHFKARLDAFFATKPPGFIFTPPPPS